MSRPLIFGIAVISAAAAWPVLLGAIAFIRGWRISVRIVDEDELRKAGL